jgi:glutathione S-transferase
MKLYYSPGACSMAPHIALEEMGMHYEIEKVDTRAEAPASYLALNPLGAVPVLGLDDGQTLTETAVILQYLADLKPDAKLAPRAGTFERVRLQEQLNFIATEIHKVAGMLWAIESLVSTEGARAELRQSTISSLAPRLDILVSRMGSRDWLMPWGYTVADPYFFVMMGWMKYHKMDLTRWPALMSHHERMSHRPATIATLKAEGLLK